MTPISCVAHTNDILGEVPLWHPMERALYWIDLFKPAIHRLDPANGTTRSWTPPAKMGSFALRASGGFILASRRGIELFDAETGASRVVGDPENGGTENILNDGRCDRKGRFWVGSMSKTLASATGRLYRVNSDLSSTVIAENIWLPNSIVWGPDWRHMYFADSHLRTIFVYDFDLDDGAISNRRIFAVCEHPGVPDGSAVDAEGFLWNAMFDGGCIVRYAPNGRVDKVLELPVTRPTSCTFGGDDLATLYVTTAQFRLPSEALDRQPYAGGMLAIDVGVRGLAEPLFAG